ncbi:hypothetical protein ASPWEDRAFT_99258 [Aspergillus wentii DTO 134E9]|uniref:3-keto-steroid reductase n=1 Tax=Aspergillus wentii DTO 134E9 TaxID=1073089 RepID=A0A1L9S073_ASPWE|nr:uncharacterized protein ASPWEDRAFT_99258 [Aspergillus wentii DTO 134E9]KAI9932993.1 3-keto-steroid reductase [Aspergillus wentii]OJJ40579.1 hypothetical protein ASPWEDRAFT_99258 [Aspergillus wentii DTO 134E9]
MTVIGSDKDLQDQIFILVTGANSGLGFSICCRLVDDFLRNRPDSQSLTVLFTTRSTRKGNDTISRLQEHLRTTTQDPTALKRVSFVPENVDLMDLVSVRALSRRLVETIPKLDSIILNAGLGGWTGLNWPEAIWGVLTDLVHQVSWPTYKIAPVGMVTDNQLSGVDEPRLGSIFCANVFGHYMLAHNVVPLLKRSGNPNGPGRIIWVSSIEATIDLFNVDDIQGMRTAAPYESSKALTDVLALTSNLPSTAPWVKSFYSLDKDDESNPPPQPNMYLTHPGICGTGILPLSSILFYAMMSSFLLARLLGSPWHTISTYMGACAPVWLALSAQALLDDAESPYQRNGGGRAKWGSACTNFSGGDHPASTEVDGWGYGGVVGSAVVEADRSRRRKRGAKDLSVEDKERFEDLGRQCWQKMEELRIQWDELLDKAEVQSN